MRRQHCSSLCSQSEGHEHVANMANALGHDFVVFSARAWPPQYSSPSLCEQSELQCFALELRQMSAHRPFQLCRNCHVIGLKTAQRLSWILKPYPSGALSSLYAGSTTLKVVFSSGCDEAVMVPPCKVTICLQMLKRVLLNTITERVGKRDDGGLSGFLSWCQMSKILTTYLFAKVIFGRHTRKGKTQEIGTGVYK